MIAIVAAAGIVPVHAAKPKAQEGAARPAYAAIQVVDGGRIAGRVLVPDPPPPHRPYPVTNDARTCGREIADERLVIGEGGALKNAVVSVEGVLRGKAVDTRSRPRLDNAGCRFVPHVLAVSVGQKLDVTNSDPIRHDTHITFEGRTTIFDLELPVQNQRIPNSVERPGLMKAECNAGHPWMSAWIHAFEHPYFAVTDDDGFFVIDDLPPGRYTVRAWHEELGTQRLEVTVRPRATSDVTFTALDR